MPKYNITVKLSNRHGKANCIMGAVIRAIKLMGAATDDIQEYVRQATNGNVFTVSREWVYTL